MPKVVVFSGGTATNSLVSAFSNVAESLTYVLPISDNGGSTAEIMRVLGGVAIGDIRSRVVRLIPDENLKKLLGHRLPDDPVKAKQEWTDIVEGFHPLWGPIDPQLKEIMRSFMIHVHTELLKKCRATSNFCYELASVGNLFLTGIRLFIGSLDASIELFMRIAQVDTSKTKIIPCLNTNHAHHISALLEDGTIVTGQSQISHPSSVHPANVSTDLEEYAQAPYIHPMLRMSQLHFSKDTIEPLAAPIERIFYINPYGEEIFPVGNARAVQAIDDADAIVYSIGSLMTSLIPILVIGNVGKAILEASRAKKILLVNNEYDRETVGMQLGDMIDSIGKSLGYASNEYARISWSNFLTDVVYLEDGDIKVPIETLKQNGVTAHCIKGHRYFTSDELEAVLKDII